MLYFSGVVMLSIVLDVIKKQVKKLNILVGLCGCLGVCVCGVGGWVRKGLVVVAYVINKPVLGS